MTSVFVFEPNGLGHRFWYAKILTAEIRNRGMRPILITLPTAKMTHEYDAYMAAEQTDVEYVRAELNTARFSQVMKLAWALRSYARRGQVVIPDADRLVVGIALFGLLFRLGSLSLLCLRAPAPGLGGIIKALAMKTVARRQAVAVLGDSLGNLERMVPKGVRVIADPVDMEDSALAPSRPSGRVVRLLVAGVINERKGVDLILDMASGRNDVHLQIIGQQSPGVRELISAHCRINASLEVRNEFVASAELANYVRQADIVACVLRTKHGSSGLLGQSIGAGKPVLAAGNRTVKGFLNRTGAGTFADDLTVASLNGAFSQLIERYDSYAAHAAEARKLLTHPREFAAALLASPGAA